MWKAVAVECFQGGYNVCVLLYLNNQATLHFFTLNGPHSFLVVSATDSEDLWPSGSTDFDTSENVVFVPMDNKQLNPDIQITNLKFFYKM